MSSLLQGKVAVITGGTSGIGLATVKTFISEGARVVVGDIQDELGASLESALGSSVSYVHADVTREDDIEALVAHAVERFGKLDIMFNNAGAQGDPSSIKDIASSGFDVTMSLLARSVALGHKFASVQFEKQGTGGSIVSTASAAGLQGGWSALGYTAAKHAVVGIVRQAVAELAPLGIRSNAVAPGVILTPIMAKSFGIPIEKSDKFESFMDEKLGSSQPLGRLGQPEDIADVALFLASDLSRYVTGAVIPVDGGATAVTQGSFASDVVRVAGDFQELS